VRVHHLQLCHLFICDMSDLLSPEVRAAGQSGRVRPGGSGSPGGQSVSGKCQAGYLQKVLRPVDDGERA